MSGVEVVMDGGAHTVIPIFGGEVWVEFAHDDTYEVGVESCANFQTNSESWGCVTLSRKELKAFRREIGRVLKDSK